MGFTWLTVVVDRHGQPRRSTTALLKIPAAIRAPGALKPWQLRRFSAWDTEMAPGNHGTRWSATALQFGHLTRDVPIPPRLRRQNSNAENWIPPGRLAPLLLSAARRVRHENAVEEAMMDARFRYIHLEVPIRAGAMKSVGPCASGDVRWILGKGTNV